MTTIGLLTLLWGVGYAVLGGSAIVGGIGWLTQPGDDPWTPAPMRGRPLLKSPSVWSKSCMAFLPSSS